MQEKNRKNKIMKRYAMIQFGNIAIAGVGISNII